MLQNIQISGQYLKFDEIYASVNTCAGSIFRSFISAILSSFGKLFCFIHSLMQFARSLQFFLFASFTILIGIAILIMAMYKTWNTGTGNGMRGTRGMGECYISGNVAKHSREYRQTFQGMLPNIPGNLAKHSGECC